MERNPKFKQESKWHKELSLTSVQMSFLIYFCHSCHSHILVNYHYYYNQVLMHEFTFEDQWNWIVLIILHMLDTNVACPRICAEVPKSLNSHSRTVVCIFVSQQVILCKTLVCWRSISTIWHAQFKELVARPQLQPHICQRVCWLNSSLKHPYFGSWYCPLPPHAFEVFLPSSESFK